MDAENDGAAKIAAETLEAADIPCLFRKTPGLIKREIYGQ